MILYSCVENRMKHLVCQGKVTDVWEETRMEKASEVGGVCILCGERWKSWRRERADWGAVGGVGPGQSKRWRKKAAAWSADAQYEEGRTRLPVFKQLRNMSMIKVVCVHVANSSTPSHLHIYTCRLGANVLGVSTPNHNVVLELLLCLRVALTRQEFHDQRVFDREDRVVIEILAVLVEDLGGDRLVSLFQDLHLLATESAHQG